MTNKEVTIREIQLTGLQILNEFVRICDEQNLIYYISGGTFIGAVRHKGFIPWDDDIDVAMPRKDYDKFLEIAPQLLDKKYELKHYKNSQNIIHYFAKIEDSTYKLIDHTASIPRKVNLWIDIFPLDGLPDKRILRKLHCFQLLALRALFKYSLFDTIVQQSNHDRPWYENIMIRFGQHVDLTKVLNSYKCMEALDKALSKYDFYDSTYVMNFMGSYKLKSVMNRKKVYADGAYYSFEGYRFRAPKDYDAYLTQIYGNYMELPPIEKRNQHQTTIVCDENE